MSKTHIEQMVRNAVLRKTSKEVDWFETIRKQLLLALHKQMEFSKVVEMWLEACKKFHATSVADAINEMVEQINKIDDE